MPTTQTEPGTPLGTYEVNDGIDEVIESLEAKKKRLKTIDEIEELSFQHLHAQESEKKKTQTEIAAIDEIFGRNSESSRLKVSQPMTIIKEMKRGSTINPFEQSKRSQPGQRAREEAIRKQTN